MNHEPSLGGRQGSNRMEQTERDTIRQYTSTLLRTDHQVFYFPDRRLYKSDNSSSLLAECESQQIFIGADLHFRRPEIADAVHVLVVPETGDGLFLTAAP